MSVHDWFIGGFAVAMALTLAGAARVEGGSQDEPRGGSAVSDAGPPSLSAAVKPPSAAVAAYLEGLGALETARWADALAAFNRALETEPDDASYVRARGVTSVLLEKFPDALRDLKRTEMLKMGDQEGRIWLAVALQMSGDDYHARETYAEVTNDAYETFLGKLRVDYWMVQFQDQLARRGGGSPDERAKAEARRRGARQRFPQAEAWYTRRMMNAPELSLSLFGRARQRLAAGEFAAALVGMEPLKARYPKDMGLLFVHAASLLGTGDAASARQELTEVLTQFTGFSEGYVKRSIAAPGWATRGGLGPISRAPRGSTRRPPAPRARSSRRSGPR
jgi:predicted Zn-dependent protease